MTRVERLTHKAIEVRKFAAECPVPVEVERLKSRVPCEEKVKYSYEVESREQLATCLGYERLHGLT